MPDRVIRDELLQSTRWLDLPSDTHRLIYENLILAADDYGNIEGGRRLFRWMHSFSQIKTESDALKLMSDLQDSDLARRYEVESREYWHLPRFKNSRWWWKRSYPQSTFADDVTNEEKQRPPSNRNKRITNTLQTRREGLGLGLKNLTLGNISKPQSYPQVNHDLEIVQGKTYAQWILDLGITIEKHWTLADAKLVVDQALVSRGTVDTSGDKV